MKDKQKPESDTHLTPAQETLQQLWEEHVRHEFNTRDHEETLATMVEDAYVNHIPVLTGGVCKDELREFYSKRSIQRRQTGPRAHLLGPGFRPGSTGVARSWHLASHRR